MFIEISIDKFDIALQSIVIINKALELIYWLHRWGVNLLENVSLGAIYILKKIPKKNDNKN